MVCDLGIWGVLPVRNGGVGSGESYWDSGAGIHCVISSWRYWRWESDREEKRGRRPADEIATYISIVVDSVIVHGGCGGAKVVVSEALSRLGFVRFLESGSR